MKKAKNHQLKINKNGDLILFRKSILMGYVKIVSTSPGLKD